MQASKFFPQQKEGFFALGLLILTFAVICTGALSESTVLLADQTLSHYWRTTYDILVRPAGARSPVEARYGLVEPNFLSNLTGGISVAQYEAIKAIPGVEIAAPEGLLTYVDIVASPEQTFPEPTEPGVYLSEWALIADDGWRVQAVSQGRCYRVIKPEDRTPGYPPVRKCLGGGLAGLTPGVMYPLGFIDPEQEARLVGLDQALLDGEYLTGREPLFTTSDPSWGVITYIHHLPVLLNATPYVSQTVFTRLSRVVLPPELTLEEVRAKDDPSVVETLPTQLLWERHIGSEEALSLAIEALRERAGEQIHFPKMFWPTKAQTYTEISSPFPHEHLLVEVDSQTPYRYVEQEAGSIAFSLELRGIFHLERLGVGLEPVNRVPLGMYTPPLATLRYDESGQPTEPIVIRPTGALTGPVPLPPLALTTLEAARLIAGDDCISAIRVRVGGIDGLTPEAQRKIEAVASEIYRKTGLDVDIMVGSSPRPVLVHVPGIGYVEEQWVQKNVTLSYSRRIQSGHLLLIAALLLTGGLFAADMAWADLLARQRVLALQKALGWRSGTLMGQVLRRAFLVGLGAGLGGTALAAGALALARQPLPSLPWLLGIPLLITVLSVLGSLYPALEAARVPPIPLLQMAGLRHRVEQGGRGRGRSGGLLLPVRYALLGVARRWSRSLLAGLTAALSAGLLVLLVGVVADRAGYLSGTLLGAYILVQVEGYHWGLVGVGLALAGTGMGNSLLAGVMERRREIGVLKAVGWRTGAVAGLFLLEGAVLGLLGGAVGTALGLLVYLGLYRSVGAGLVWAVAAGLGVPVGVGVLAAAYPARVAAAVPPAEALRGSRKQEAGAGGRRQEAGGRRQEAGGRRQEAGGRRQEAGGRGQEAGGREQGAGGRRQGAGGRRQGAGGRRQEAGRQEAGGRGQEAGGREAGGRRQEAGGRGQEAGGQEAGGRGQEQEQEAGGRRQEAGGRRQGAGGRRQEAGGREQEAGGREAGGRRQGGRGQEAGGRGQEAGGRRQEAGGRGQEAGGRRQEAGGRRQEAGGRRQEAGGRRQEEQEAGGRRQEAGGRRQEAGGRRQEAGGREQGQEAGGRRQEAGGREAGGRGQEAGGRRQEAGGRRQEAGRQEAGGRGQEAGSRRQEAGGRRQEAGGRRQGGRRQGAGGRRQEAGGREAGGRRQEAGAGAGGRRQEAGGRRQGGRRQGAGGRRQEAGGRRQEAGGRRQGAGGREQEAGGRRQEAGGRIWHRLMACRYGPRCGGLRLQA